MSKNQGSVPGPIVLLTGCVTFGKSCYTKAMVSPASSEHALLPGPHAGVEHLCEVLLQ